MAIPSYLWTAADIINTVAPGIGLPTFTDPYSASDENAKKLRGCLKTVGLELSGRRLWPLLRKECTYTTTDEDTGVYALPSDFRCMCDQTGWERAGQEPLEGPLSTQEWHYVVGEDQEATMTAFFREVQGELWLYPQPPPVGLDISFEYASRYWVASTGKDPAHVAVRWIDVVDWDSAVVAQHLTPRGFDLPHIKIYDASGKLLFEQSSGPGKLAPMIEAIKSIVAPQPVAPAPVPPTTPPADARPHADTTPAATMRSDAQPPVETPPVDKGQTPPSKIEPPAETKPAPARPVKPVGVAITANERGFEPQTITVPRGKPVKLEFTRTIERTCATEVAFEHDGTLKTSIQIPRTACANNEESLNVSMSALQSRIARRRSSDEGGARAPAGRVPEPRQGTADAIGAQVEAPGRPRWRGLRSRQGSHSLRARSARRKSQAQAKNCED